MTYLAILLPVRSRDRSTSDLSNQRRRSLDRTLRSRNSQLCSGGTGRGVSPGRLRPFRSVKRLACLAIALTRFLWLLVGKRRGFFHVRREPSSRPVRYQVTIIGLDRGKTRSLAAARRACGPFYFPYPLALCLAVGGQRGVRGLSDVYSRAHRETLAPASSPGL